jgi:hypothetical protein
LIFHGKLLDTVFSLPEPLFPFLYPEIPVKEHSPLRVLLARFYVENQMYSEALHLLHDQWILGTRSPEVISFIIKTSIAARDFGPTKKYISLFEKTLFYKKAAQQYKISICEKQKSDSSYTANKYKDMRTDAYTPDLTILSRYRQIENDKDLLVQFRGLFEYANLSLLLRKALSTRGILYEIDNSKLFGYASVPSALQQALIISDSAAFYRTEIGKCVDNKTLTTYNEYSTQFFYFNTQKISLQTLSTYFSKNYFYFYDFTSQNIIRQ